MGGYEIVKVPKKQKDRLGGSFCLIKRELLRHIPQINLDFFKTYYIQEILT